MASEFTGWRKASYSGQNGGCVEIGWRKSTHSDANGGCVEVASDRLVIGVRDTRQHGRGPVLEFGPAAWLAFVASVGADRV
jgi:Domain of unknown function (DUF397)